MIVTVGKFSNTVTTPIRTAAIVAPTRGISEKSPAITASGAANGHAEDREDDEGRDTRDQRDRQRAGHVAGDRLRHVVERAPQPHALLARP